MLGKKLETSTVEADALLPTKYGTFRIRAFIEETTKKEHALLYLEGEGKIPLVRIHSECLTGDVFGSLKCDCGPQLEASMKEIQEYGYGAIVYARQEGRGIGLAHKLHAYQLQENGMDTVEANLELGFDADERDYCISAQILKDLNMDRVNLLTNNPAKVTGLEFYGIYINERVPLIIEPTNHNKFYIQTKREKMGHVI